jgi:putative sterol carrier protein
VALATKRRRAQHQRWLNVRSISFRKETEDVRSDAMPIATIDDYMRATRQNFLPEQARGRRATLQYHFSGRVADSCYAQIDDGALLVAQGTHLAPTATVWADFDLWLRILSYEVDGLLALQAGEYQVEGDLETLMESDTWFRR